MAAWNNENEMFELMKEKLYTPVVGDILDQMGYKHQFLPAPVRPTSCPARPRTSGLDWPVTPAPCWKMTCLNTRKKSRSGI